MSDVYSSKYMLSALDLDSRSSARRSTAHAQSKHTARNYIAIGIDFGTTYSGVSWAFSETPGHIFDVKQWPCHSSRGRDEIQIPTQVDLDTKDWGYKVANDREPIRWFKLLLLESKDWTSDMKESPQFQEAQKKLNASKGDSAEKIVSLIATFLRHLWSHTVEEIRKEITVDSLPFKVAITVPAIWPQYAKQRMRRAAEVAGILDPRPIGQTTLILVNEPEAAAIATLFEKRDYPEIEVGASFIVCDCGGGTVDIISYIVTSVKPFKIEEAVVGKGKLCGAFLTDSAFENWFLMKSGLKFKAGEASTFRAFVNDEWEYSMKRAFSGKESQETFAIRPPAKVFSVFRRAKGSTDSFPVPKNVVETFFAKTRNGIRTLISEQRQTIIEKHGKEPTKILLVGGLGASPYLFAQLQEQYKNVQQPARAWSAVARGAVMGVLKGTFDPNTMTLEALAELRSLPDIEARIARLSYGVRFAYRIADVSPPVNRSLDKFWKDPSGVEKVWRMKWYLRQHESVYNRDPVDCDFAQWSSTYGAKEAVTTIIRTCDVMPPPCRIDASVKELATVSCELNDLAWESAQRYDGTDGQGQWHIDNLRLTMRFEAEPKWMLRVGDRTVVENANVQLMDM